MVTSWVITGIGVVAIEIGAVAWSAGTAVALGYPLLLMLALLTGLIRRSYRVQADQSAALLAQVEQLRAGQREVAVLNERTRIAREIHDVLAHSLGALGIQIQTARAVLSDQRDIDRALGILEQAQRIASDGLGETRRNPRSALRWAAARGGTHPAGGDSPRPAPRSRHGERRP